MKTAEENRRDWLEKLITESGSIASLNTRLDRDRTDATLSQIRNKSAHHKSGKPRNMGSDIAREIEEKLGLERGTLDYPPVRANDPRPGGLRVAEASPPHYGEPANWPFLTVSPDEWARIPRPKQEFLEEQIKALVPLIEANSKAA